MPDDPIHEARRALQALQAELDKLEKARARPRAKARAVAAPPRALKIRAAPKITRLLEEATGQLKAAGMLADLGTSFEDFFQEVGLGLVRAQNKMDEASRQYLAGISTQRFLPPSIFRIPKLTAQMRFALDHTQGFKLFFSKEETQSKQQSVEFEVVSAPPPSPGVAAPFLYDPILSPPRRKAVFDSIAKAGGPNDLLNNRDRVLILVNERNVQYIILFADAQSKCGAWFLLDDPQTPALLTMRNLSAGIESVGKIVFEQGNYQAKFLQALG